MQPHENELIPIRIHKLTHSISSVNCGWPFLQFTRLFSGLVHVIIKVIFIKSSTMESFDPDGKWQQTFSQLQPTFLNKFFGYFSLWESLRYKNVWAFKWTRLASALPKRKEEKIREQENSLHSNKRSNACFVLRRLMIVLVFFYVQQM